MDNEPGVSRSRALAGRRLAFILATALGGMLSPAVNAASNEATATQTEAEWPLHGRGWQGARFSPLNDINEGNIGRLGLTWSFKIEPDSGVEATPIVVNGIMYVTGPYSIVYALDATSGRLLWRHDPKVDRGISGRACCGPVNRGVAVAEGKVFVGVFDGRLITLDARTGNQLWSVDTLIDHARNYTITGAPLVVRGKVLIGNGGGEFGVRGYVTAYDAHTGQQSWRFFTVPAGPDASDANTPAMKIALPTWHGNTYSIQGGGGTVWDSMIYDPQLDLVYIGVGNGSLWSRKLRSEGKGDNLFLSSIVALKPQTGAYVWHYQTTPGDEWDYTATQNMILADLQIGGRLRKVIMQAPKNGFFYVLDRSTGELLSAKNFVPVNWAKGVDLKSGRPLVNDELAHYSDGKLKLVSPAMIGAHNWQPMSFSPATGLVYIPAQITAMYIQSLSDPALPKHLGTLSMGISANLAVVPDPKRVTPPTDTEVPDLRNAADVKRVRESWKGKLIAWDPVNQREVWGREYPHIWSGGTLATAGNLVFQGTSDGRLVSYRASDGTLLWEVPVSTGIMAPPISYRVGGVQYIAVAAGWGGAYPLTMGAVAQAAKMRTDARILVYRLDGQLKLPARTWKPLVASVLPQTGSAEDVAAGRIHFAIHCLICHGFEAIGGGVTPDLRYMSRVTFDAFPAIVNGGFAPLGMPDFSKKLNDQEINQIRHYLAERNAELRRDLADATKAQSK